MCFLQAVADAKADAEEAKTIAEKAVAEIEKTKAEVGDSKSSYFIRPDLQAQSSDGAEGSIFISDCESMLKQFVINFFFSLYLF